MTRQGRRGGTGGGRGGRTGRPSTRGRRRDSPPASRNDDDIPLVYHEMLSEVRRSGHGLQTDSSGDARRAAKRRRVGDSAASRAVVIGDERVFGPRRAAEAGGDGEIGTGAENKPVQTVYDVDASEESAMEWEEVDLDIPQNVPPEVAGGRQSSSAADGSGAGESLELTLENNDGKAKQKSVPRRKPATALEKRWRLDIHKVHILCLLSHVHMRNNWCNDEEVQKSLKRILPKNVIMCLNPRPELPQFTRSTTFADGLKQAAETWRRRYRITAPGMRRPHWLERPEEVRSESFLHDSAEILPSKYDFRTQAAALNGSRDLGAQLFCSLLRAVGVGSRLVCSLQVLPLGGVAKGETPKKLEREYIVISDADNESSTSNTRPNTPATQSAPTGGLSQPWLSTKSPFSPRSAARTGAGVSDSMYPVFWVEAFNEAMQRWVTVDPMVTNTIGEPGRLEPPSADRLNNMSYVVAFEDDLSARDVTRRYVQSFNSKTRKTRVEQTKDGEKWWSRTMQVFERPFLEDRDQVEFGELTSKAAAEGMPRNVQDFKDHPIYALERHLRRNEVIHPKREIGKVGLSKLGTSKKSQQLESVYRRENVHVVKSANGWYRQGRSIKAGEQPIKRVPFSRSKMPMLQDDVDNNYDEDEAQEMPMYAMFQTEVYQPPPVVDGRVPKNNYGNIDVYAATMVPQGGFHLKHADAALAARILDINYADAVTGFQFKGRQGTALTHGIVAAVEYQESLYAVVSALEDERTQAEQNRRTVAALRMWKQLLTKLRVAERVESYTFEGDDRNEDEGAEAGPPDDLEEVGGGGGFIPEGGQEGQGKPLPGSALVSPPGSGLAGASTTELADNKLGQEIGKREGAGQSPCSDAVDKPPQAARRGVAQGSKPNNSKHTPRYNLIVVPNKGKEPAKAESSGIDPQTTPTHNDNAPEETPAVVSNTGSEEQHNPVITGAQDDAALVTGSSSAAPVVIDSSTAERSVSVEQGAALPELVHSDSASEASGSMLSHDPEDEDAVPEWLLSD